MNGTLQQKKLVLHLSAIWLSGERAVSRLGECFLRSRDAGNLLQVFGDAYFPPAIE